MDRDIPVDIKNREIDGRKPHERVQPRFQDRDESRSAERLDRPGTQPLTNSRLSEVELKTLTDIGQFRTLSPEDLQLYRYGTNPDQMERDLRHLACQKLIRTRSVWSPKQGQLRFIALTRRGKETLEQSGLQGTFYFGFVKPAEMAHDARIYQMYQKEAAKIVQQGGTIRRIALDFELKRAIYSPLARTRPGSAEYKKAQAEIAARQGLKIVRGHIQLPDLRIEYQARDGSVETVDLELATPHYRPGQLAAKSEAGFKFYASSADKSHLKSVFDEHHIVSEILWL